MKLPKAPDKMQPVCQYCYAYIHTQATIDDRQVRLNPDGSKHKCKGTLEEERLASRGPMYVVIAPTPAKRDDEVVHSRRVRVVIGEADAVRVRKLARSRNKKESKFGGMNYGNEGGVRGSLESHVIGVFAELAVARDSGVDVDERIFEDRGDDGTDLIHPVIGPIGVKASSYEPPILRVEVEHFKGSISYVLCAIKLDQLEDATVRVDICGWATADELKLGEIRKMALGNYPLNYTLPEWKTRRWPPTGPA